MPGEHRGLLELVGVCLACFEGLLLTLLQVISLIVHFDIILRAIARVHHEIVILILILFVGAFHLRIGIALTVDIGHVLEVRDLDVSATIFVISTKRRLPYDTFSAFTAWIGKRVVLVIASGAVDGTSA